MARVEPPAGGAEHVAVADRQHLLDRALGDHQVATPVGLQHHGHPPALKIERDLVHLGDRGDAADMLGPVGMAEHRLVQQVAQAGLVVAVEVGVFEHAFALLALEIQVVLQDHPVLGQRAGLVGAQHVHRAEILDGVQPFHDDLPPCHLHRALGQVDGHDHRQHFRRQPHRDGHGEQQRLQPVALGDPVDQEHRRHHHADEADHQPGEARDAAVEAGRRPFADHAVRELAEIGRYARLQDHAGGGAAEHVAAHEADVLQVERVVAVVGRDDLGLVDRHRLAGQRRLVDVQGLGGEQADIGWNQVAGRHLDDIAGHQLVDRDLQQPGRAGGGAEPCAECPGMPRPSHRRKRQSHPRSFDSDPTCTWISCFRLARVILARPGGSGLRYINGSGAAIGAVKSNLYR